MEVAPRTWGEADARRGALESFTDDTRVPPLEENSNGPNEVSEGEARAPEKLRVWRRVRQVAEGAHDRRGESTRRLHDKRNKGCNLVLAISGDFQMPVLGDFVTFTHHSGAERPMSGPEGTRRGRMDNSHIEIEPLVIQDIGEVRPNPFTVLWPWLQLTVDAGEQQVGVQELDHRIVPSGDGESLKLRACEEVDG